MTTIMRYNLLDEEVNPGVLFDEDKFILKMPILEIFIDNHEAEIRDTEFYLLTKKEIINNFVELFIKASEGDGYIEEDGCEWYEQEDEEMEITYSLLIIPEENKFELGICYAQNIGVFEYPLYSSIYHAKDNTNEVYNQLIEDSHIFFHEDLMRIAQVYKNILL